MFGMKLNLQLRAERPLRKTKGGPSTTDNENLISVRHVY
jgi:hypothetical protein